MIRRPRGRPVARSIDELLEIEKLIRNIQERELHVLDILQRHRAGLAVLTERVRELEQKVLTMDDFLTMLGETERKRLGLPEVTWRKS